MISRKNSLTSNSTYQYTAFYDVNVFVIRLSEVNFILGSAKVYGFKHFGLYFSDNAYSEAVQGIQEGMRQARVEVIKKATDQGILTMALKEAKDYFY